VPRFSHGHNDQRRDQRGDEQSEDRLHLFSFASPRPLADSERLTWTSSGGRMCPWRLELGR
jgi:hypothetical protein